MRCRSTPGFIVNRVARPFYAEARRALEEQVATSEVIDAALRDGGGFPMGPLALTDLIGQDVNFAVTCSVLTLSGRTDVFCRRCCNRSWLLPGVWARRVVTVFIAGLLKHSRNWRWLRCQRNAAQNIKRDVVTELDDVLLLETTGETALALSVQHNRPVVVYDYAAGGTVVLASAATNSQAATDKAVYFFQQQGKKCCALPIIPVCWCGARWRCWRTKRWTRCKKASPAPRISIPPCDWASTTRTARLPGRNAGMGARLAPS